MAERRFKVQTTGEMRPTPRVPFIGPALGAVSSMMQSASPVLDKSLLSLANAAGLQDYFGPQGEIPESIPLLGGSTISDIMLGKMPEEIERWSYGNFPMTIPSDSMLPVMKTGRAEPFAETLINVSPLARPAARGVRAIPEGIKMAGEDLLRAGVTGAPAIVKPRGGQWVASDVRGSPEAVAETLKLDNPIGPEKSINDWLESTLTKYIKRDLGTAEDPVRALAEKGVLHYEPTPLTTGYAKLVKEKRTAQLGQSELAKKWEDISDISVNPFTAGEMRQRLTAEELEAMPWILNVPEETPVYETFNTRMTGHRLGMSSLRDQLLNAVDPESSLPKNLQLRPESLSRMSMPQAVEHVAKINKWKADNASKKILAAAEGIPVHKEYAEGFKWLAPGDTRKDKKAMQYIKEAGCDLGWCTKEEGAALNYGSGDSRVYILSDKKGKPLAQISTVEKEGELPDIQEIQGPFNKPPTGDALKYVQDFVKSKTWGFVGDPERVGLLEIGGQFMTQPELDKSISDAIKAVSSKRPSTGDEAGLQGYILSVLHGYGTKDLEPEDIANALDDARTYVGKGAGFAKGGSVDLKNKYGVDRSSELPDLISNQTYVEPPLSAGEYLENLSYGLGRGFESQLEGAYQLARHPIESGKAMYQAGKQVVQNPAMLAEALKSVGQQATSGPLGLGQVVGEYLNPRSLMPKPKMEIVSPDLAKTLSTKLDLPVSEEFNLAVSNTLGAEITPEGLRMKVLRQQLPEQEGAQSVRTGVFYLPSGDPSKKQNTGTSGYAVSEKYEGDTLLQRPLFVKGATGGKAPEQAYDQLKGKGAYEQMRKDVVSVFSQKDKVEATKNILKKYGADPQLAYEIVENSKRGNLLPYAIQENIVAHAVRDAGFDSVLGYSRTKSGLKISELFDVRELTYPARNMDPYIHEAFERK